MQDAIVTRIFLVRKCERAECAVRGEPFPKCFPGRGVQENAHRRRKQRAVVFFIQETRHDLFYHGRDLRLGIWIPLWRFQGGDVHPSKIERELIDDPVAVIGQKNDRKLVIQEPVDDRRKSWRATAVLDEMMATITADKPT